MTWFVLLLCQILGDKDDDGFFMGEALGRRGLVPCNMISEVQVDDPDVADQLMLESSRSVPPPSHQREGDVEGGTFQP